MTGTDELFSTLRELLSNDKTEETKQALLALLKQVRKANKETYNEIWLPYLTEQKEWFAEPLCWTKLGCMGGGMLSNPDDIAQQATPVDTYKELLPFAPIKCYLSGHRHYDEYDLSLTGYQGLDTEDWSKCWGVSINKPHYGWDDGQNGYGMGTESPDSILKALSEYADNMLNVQFFELIENPSPWHHHTIPGGWDESSDSLAERMPSELCDEGMAYLQHILPHFPLQELRLGLQQYPKNLRWLTELGWWKKLERLSLINSLMDSGAIEVFFPHTMPNLTDLSLKNNPYFTDKGVQHLAKSRSFPALETLDLQGCNVTEEGEALLLASEHLPSLTTILR
jgi:hypothetical protein